MIMNGKSQSVMQGAEAASLFAMTPHIAATQRAELLALSHLAIWVAREQSAKE